MTKGSLLALNVLVVLILMSCTREQVQEIEVELDTIIESEDLEEPLVFTSSQKEHGLSLYEMHLEKQVFDKGEEIQVEIVFEYVISGVKEVNVLIESNDNVKLSDTEFQFAVSENQIQEVLITTILNSSELSGQGTIRFYLSGDDELLGNTEEQRISLHYFGAESRIAFSDVFAPYAEYEYILSEYEGGNLGKEEFEKIADELFNMRGE